MGLVGWWRLDGNALDSSGRNNNGTAISNVIWSNGLIGQCGGFNNSFIIVGTGNTFLPMTTFSMSSWVRTPGLGAGMSLNGILSITFGLTMFLDSLGRTNFRITSSPSGTMFVLTDTTNLHDNMWHHVVCSHDGTTMRIYIDGRLGISAPYSEWNRVTNWMTSGAVIGKEINNGPIYRFNGLIDDVRIYNHALSAKEVKDLAQAKIAHWTFDDFQEPTINLWHGGFGIYNNFGMPASLVATGETAFGSPVFRLTMTPNTQAQVDSIRANLWNHGVLGSWMTYLASTQYTTSVYWRPINRTDIQVDGLASNIGGWTNGGTTFEQGWSRCISHRDGSVAVDRGDNIFWSFRSPSAVINEPIVIDWVAPQIEQKIYATPFVIGSRTGVVKDCSGFDNHGRIDSASSPRWTDNTIIGSGAYLFNGRGHINTQQQFNFSRSGSFSVSFWINPNNHSHKEAAAAGILGKGHWFSNTWDVFILNNNSIIFECGGDISPGGGNAAITINGILLNQWQHISFTYDNGTMRGYRNGLLVSTGTNTFAGDFNGNRETLIAMRPTDTSRRFEGLLDDVRIYATALSNSDILEIYQNRANLDEVGNLSALSIEEHTNWDEKITANNLVINGTQNMRNNFNFPFMIFENNHLRSSVLWHNDQSSQLMPVNREHVYRGEGEFRNGSPGVIHRFFYGLACYDEERRFIDHWMVHHYFNTRTLLTQELRNGDTVVRVNSVANWHCPAQGAANVWNQVLTAWLPESIHPVFTYSRVGGNHFTHIDNVNNTITLQTPWASGTVPLGTNVANAFWGGTFNYTFAVNPIMPDTWTNYTGTITGWGINNDSMFRYGTRFVRLLFLFNRDVTGGTPITCMRNLRFWNLTTGQHISSSLDKTELLSNGVFKAQEFSEIGPADGLIAWWPFNGDARDLSGSNLDGVVSGATIVNGRDGLAYRFAGVGGSASGQPVISVADPNSIIRIDVGRPFTFSFWMRSSTTETAAIIRKNGQLEIYKSGNNIVYRTWNPDTLDWPAAHTFNGQWIHVVATHDGMSTAQMYINGQLAINQRRSGTPALTNASLGIGAYPETTWGSNADICDVKIYNRTLSLEEIRLLSNPSNMLIADNKNLYTKRELITV